MDRAMQTDKIQNLEMTTPDYDILNKLPPMNNETGKSGKPQKKMLNINITRGQHDECFNCHDLKKKIKEKSAYCDKLK